MRVLLIEDDELIAHGILAGLRAHGLIADAVNTASQGAAAIANLHCDVVILDLGLPDEDGASLLARIRAKGFPFPCWCSARAIPWKTALRCCAPAPTITCSSRSTWTNWWRACMRCRAEWAGAAST